MPKTEPLNKMGNDSSDSLRIDASLLVGHEVTIISGQYPGRPLRGKITAASHNGVTVGRLGGNESFSDLAGDHSLYLQFIYREQRISAKGYVKRSSEGNCVIELDEQVVPLCSRKYSRMKMESATVRMALLPLSTLNSKKLDKLRWVSTTLNDISGGGARISYNSQLSRGASLFMNVEVEGLRFPRLMVAQVRHCNQLESGGFRVGVEFIINESKEKHLSPSAIERIPASLFDLTTQIREEQNKTIIRMVKQAKGE